MNTNDTGDDSKPMSGAETMLQNLKFNSKLDHIDYVEHGVRPVDDDYCKFKDEFIKLWGEKKYKSESVKREELVEELYGTNWKSKRIKI